MQSKMRLVLGIAALEETYLEVEEELELAYCSGASGRTLREVSRESKREWRDVGGKAAH